MKYDYIIAGAGCAGLSLLHAILIDEKLQNKTILVVDKDQKKSNDRTWCFWEKEAGDFEQILYHQWKKLQFLSSDIEKEFDLEKYTYKMIRGIDFYNHIFKIASQFKNVSFVNEEITHISSTKNTGKLTTKNNEYEANFIFNSTNLFNPKTTTEDTLLQHFKGWNIKVEKPVFNDKLATLMDFRIQQKQGATFMYVLPTSPTEALIEYTLFSKEILDQNEYISELKKYINTYLKIDSYEIVHEEFGVIPMSLANFKRSTEHAKNVINIGTAGGFTKASSGYTFQFIQKNTQAIVTNLKADKNPLETIKFREKVFEWYDRTLLEVLLSEKLEGKEIFSTMFKKVPADIILAFLGNESTILEELKIMTCLPLMPFLSSGIKQLT